MTRIDASNYYECDPQSHKDGSPERYPKNHINYSALLNVVKWIDSGYRLFGSHGFKFKKAMLKEFDSSAPLDKYLGNEVDIKENRDIIESFCDGIDNNPYLSAIGRFLLKKMATDWLKNRKKVLQHYDANKDFIEANGKFKAPVIITGSPRSGTTLLQRLMSEDPNTRSPFTYEMEAVLPPLAADADPMKDPRIKKSGAAMATVSKLAPGFLEKFAESHLWSATEMEESYIYMLAHNGMHFLNQPNAGKIYTDKMFTMKGKRPVFRYERMFFKTLDAYRPAKSHWTLKSPSYADFFPVMMEEFTDARIVLTHRNPLITLPSISRLEESWCIAFDRDGAFDKQAFGAYNVPYVKGCIMEPLKYRKKHPEKENQFFDCMYDDFFSDPIGMVKKIYNHFDLEYTEELEKRMRAYLENNKQGKYGRHTYSLEEYGFDGQALFEEFKEYMEHYDYGIPEKIERKASFDFGLK